MTLTLTETIETKGYNEVQSNAPSSIADKLKQFGQEGVPAVAGFNQLAAEWVVVAYATDNKPVVVLRAAAEPKA